MKLSVFENVGENGRPYFKTTISKIYREASGEWKTTNSFSTMDLRVLQMLAADAERWQLEAEAARNKEQDAA